MNSRESAWHVLKIIEYAGRDCGACCYREFPYLSLILYQMMDNDRNSWQHWQAGSAGSYLTDTGGDVEVYQSPTTLHPVDPYASWLYSDLEDHQRNAFSSGPFESIENPIPSTNWEFRSQFQVNLNGNSHASPESWKNFPVAGDAHVETAAGPENLGMCSRATQGPLPTRIAQNLKPRRIQNKIDGVKRSAGRRQRGPNWTVEENRSFLQLMEVQKGKSPWKAISESLKAMGFVRESKACEDHWGVLLADLKRIGSHFRSDNILRDLHLWPSVGTMSREQRSQNGLPLVFEEEWFEAIARIVNERSKNRKSRSLESSKGKIHVGGTPSSSSCRQQSRVSAASATLSSVIFDNSVGDEDGISGLVKLLGSADRNLTTDQIIEVTRMRLEAQKLALRSQEIELERDRMYMYQDGRNRLPEKARFPPAAHEWNRRGSSDTSGVMHPTSEHGYE